MNDSSVLSKKSPFERLNNFIYSNKMLLLGGIMGILLTIGHTVASIESLVGGIILGVLMALGNNYMMSYVIPKARKKKLDDQAGVRAKETDIKKANSKYWFYIFVALLAAAFSIASVFIYSFAFINLMGPDIEGKYGISTTTTEIIAAIISSFFVLDMTASSLAFVGDYSETLTKGNTDEAYYKAYKARQAKITFILQSISLLPEMLAAIIPLFIFMDVTSLASIMLVAVLGTLMAISTCAMRYIGNRNMEELRTGQTDNTSYFPSSFRMSLAIIAGGFNAIGFSLGTYYTWSLVLLKFGMLISITFPPLAIGLIAGVFVLLVGVPMLLGQISQLWQYYNSLQRGHANVAGAKKDIPSDKHIDAVAEAGAVSSSVANATGILANNADTSSVVAVSASAASIPIPPNYAENASRLGAFPAPPATSSFESIPAEQLQTGGMLTPAVA